MKKTMLTLCLAILLCCGVATAQKWIRTDQAPPSVAKQELKIEGDKKVGSIQTVIHTVTALENLKNVRVSISAYGGATLVAGERWKYYGVVLKGSTITTKWNFRADTVPAGISINARDGKFLDGGPYREYRYIAKDGTLLTAYEYLKAKTEITSKLIEYQYDPDDPLSFNEQNIVPGQISDEKAKATRAAIERLKTKGPITDMEAIELLHNRIELFIRTGIEGQEAIDILWEAFKNTKSKGGDYWQNVDDIVKARKTQFFRPDGYNSLDNNSTIGFSDKAQTPKATVTVTGQFMYKKHCYDKNSGLLATTIDMPIRRAKIWVWGYWSGQGLTRLGPTMTDENGSFTLNILNVTLPAYFCPFIYCKGPAYSGTEFERVKVVANNIKFNYPDGTDSTTWRFRWSKWDTVNSTSWTFSNSPSYAGAHSADGGLYPTSTQPRSGAVNIFDNLLKAYQFLVNNVYTTPDTIYRVAAKWQPGYQQSTACVCATGAFVDTIFVNGDTLSNNDNSNTDEWDDLFAMHEFGHHVMAKCAVYPPNSTGQHSWNESYPSQPNLAYSEGWANFFAHVVSDSIHCIDTRKPIGVLDDSVYYWNIENPWSYRDSANNPVKAGPYCEAAIAGSLWDIYDAIDEVPYPNSLRADTLTMGFDEIWNIVDDYKYYGHNCYNIWNFMKGWDDYKYNHYTSYEKNILRHHKIYRPGAPSGLTVTIVPPSYWTTVLNWVGSVAKSSGAKDDTIAVGYNIYRKDEGDAYYRKINDTTVTGLTYNDIGLYDNKNYSYKVMAVDSALVEGAASDSVDIYVPHPPFKTQLSNATAFNNTHKLLYSPASGKAHLIYGSDKGLYYSYSTDFGFDWSTDTILSYGADNRSCLALDSAGHPSVLWQANGVFEYIHQASPWVPPVPVLPALMVSKPAMAMSNKDTAYVCYIQYNYISNEETAEGAVHIAKFPAADFTAAIVETLGITGKTPMVAVDDSNNIYIAYVSGNDIYYAARASGIWGNPVNLSQSSAVSQHPMIDVYGDKLSVTWEEDNGGNFDIYNRILTISTNTWTNSENVSNNSSNSLNPTTTMAGYLYWSDNENGYYRIYSKRYIDGTGWPDSTKRMITNNDSICNYPQITFNQTIDTTKILAIWTQGSYSPYDVSFQRNITPPAAKIFVDGGTELASPFNISRDGFKVFGPASYQSIDYGAEEVAYKFDDLNINNDYKVSVTYYFENVESDAKSPNNKPIWHEQLKIDKQTIATSKVKAGQPTTVEALVPPQWFSKDGSIVVTVKNINGNYAMATDVKLYEFSKPNSTVKSTDGGTQTAFTTPATLPLTNQLCQNAPNPFGNQPTIIHYAVTKPGNVSLNVYNISGQLVKTLVNENKQAGYHNVKWNGKDESGRQAASGVYFYRIKANGFEDTRKLLVVK